MTSANEQHRKQWLSVGLAGAALVAALAALLREPASPLDAPPAAAASTNDDAALRAAIAALQQRVAVLESTSPRQEVFDQQRIEEMIAKALLDAGEARSPAAARELAKGSPAATAAAARLVQELAQTPAGPLRDELWQKLHELGGIDAAVAHFERMAAAQPGSADAQTELGAAYIEKMLRTPDEQQRIELGKKVDAQFDRALELQPDHWEARFRKAIGLTYGPTLSGRQGEAIAHFEKLVAQQVNLPSDPRFAQTYLYLGRLHAQRGDAARARQIWQEGLARHPKDAELLQATQR